MTYIVDENVPMTANDVNRDPPQTPQADVACKIACIDKLQEIVAHKIVALDEAGEILDRYRSKLNSHGMPGVGDAFLKHLSDRQGDLTHVRKFQILKNDAGDFRDYPNDQALSTFDPSDRIFVSLACVATDSPKILNAVDSDYRHHAAALAAVNVVVEEICPHCLKAQKL